MEPKIELSDEARDKMVTEIKANIMEIATRIDKLTTNDMAFIGESLAKAFIMGLDMGLDIGRKSKGLTFSIFIISFFNRLWFWYIS